MRVFNALILFTLLLCGTTASGAHGDELQDSLANLATDLAKILRGMQQDSVVLEQFTGPPIAASNSGPGIHDILKRELENNSIRVSRRAEFGIQGKYFVSTGLDDRPVAKIEASIVNSAGAVEVGVDRAIAVDVKGTEAMALLFGGTASLSPSQPKKQREKTLFAAIQSPRVHLKEDTLQASPTSPYAVEIWVYPGTIKPGQNPADVPYQPRPIVADDGLAVVDLKRDENYAVKLINRSKLDAAISLSIDGLSTFSFAERKPDFWIVGAGKSAFIYGWYTTNSTVDAFQITSYAKSAAKELNQNPGKVGVITAAFRAAWLEDQAPPADELAAQFTARGKGDEATGRGPELTQQFTVVERKKGVIRDVISIRYDR